MKKIVVLFITFILFANSVNAFSYKDVHFRKKVFNNDVGSEIKINPKQENKDNESNIKDETEVKKTIKNYLDKINLVNRKLTIPDMEEIKDGKDKKFIIGKITVLIELLKANNFKVMYNDYNIKDMQIKFAKNKCKVKFKENQTTKYKHLADFSYIEISHEMVLEKINNQWKIESDDTNDMLDKIIENNDMTIEEVIKIQKENIKNIKEIIKDSKKDKPYKRKTIKNICNDKDKQNKQTALPLLGDPNIHLFDRFNMNKYMFENWNKRPDNWGNFDNYGGDCTNYVSQVIYAGSTPMDKEGGYLNEWYYESMSSRAPTWTGVYELHEYLVNNRGIGPIAEDSNPRECKTGDLIQLDFDGDDKYEHSLVIVNNCPQYFYTTISCHTYDRYNYPLFMICFRQARWIKLTGYKK